MEPANAKYIKHLNQRRVLNLIRQHGEISSSTIAEMAGLRRSTVSGIISRISKKGLIKHVGYGPSTGGKPPEMLALNSEKFLQVGVKVVRDISAVLLRVDGTILAQYTAPLCSGMKHDQYLDIPVIVDVIEKVLRIGGRELKDIRGVGIGLPGWIDSNRGVVVYSPLLGWRNLEVVDLLSNRLGVPVLIENEVRASALGELWFGAGKAFRTVLVLSLDEGFGSALVIDGNVYTGAHGKAGEIGHAVFHETGIECTCGKRDCLTTVLSVKGLRSRVRRAVEGGSLPAHFGSIIEESDFVERFFAEARVNVNSEFCSPILSDLAQLLGMTIANVLNLYDPEKVIIGGSLIRHGKDLILPRAKDVMKQHVFGDLHDDEIIVESKLTSNAQAVGAATLVIKSIFEDGKIAL